MITRTQIIEAARNYLDVPWLHQGRNIHGIDCVGLLIMVGRDIGLDMKDVKAYSLYYDPIMLARSFRKNNCKKIPKTNAIAGDIVTIRVGNAATHVGILTMKENVLHLIHAYRSSRTVREEVVYPLLKKRFYFGYVYPGVS